MIANKHTLILLLFILVGLSSCQQGKQAESKPKELKVLTLNKDSVVISKDYPARIVGKVNVDIRTQVSGYISKIFVEEGDYVKTGANLFKIDDRTYIQQLHTAEANLKAAQAALINAGLEVEKYSLLSENNVTSDFQLRTAKAQYESALANVSQQKAAVETARINQGFTLIKAPVDGFIGRIPKRIGNLVSASDAQALTTLSDISEVYVYFSMSEKDFLLFNRQYEGGNMTQKIKKMAPVSLMLANGSSFRENGRIEVINGEFDTNTGAISVRATFKNPELLLRTGNTGRIIVPHIEHDVFLVPVLATTDVQNKIFAIRLTKDNLAERIVLNVEAKQGDDYIIRSGLNDGDRIVTQEIETIMDGELITPKID
jgi:membrane fusion protein (multidrug efflux system)